MPLLHTLIADANLTTLAKMTTYSKDVEARDKNGMLAMQLAAREGFDCIILALFCAGGDVNLSTLLADNQAGKPPLYLAAEYGHLFTAQILLACGADIKRSIHLAVYNNQPEVRKTLEDLPLFNYSFLETVLFKVVRTGTPEILEKMLATHHYTPSQDFIGGMIEYAIALDKTASATVLLRYRKNQVRYHSGVYCAGFWSWFKSFSAENAIFCITDEDWILTLHQLQLRSPLSFSRCYDFVDQSIKDKFHASKKIIDEEKITGHARLIYEVASMGSDVLKVVSKTKIDGTKELIIGAYLEALNYAYANKNFVALFLLVQLDYLSKVIPELISSGQQNLLNLILIYEKFDTWKFFKVYSYKMPVTIASRFMFSYHTEKGIFSLLSSRGISTRTQPTAKLYSYIKKYLISNPASVNIFLNSLMMSLKNKYDIEVKYQNINSDYLHIRIDPETRVTSLQSRILKFYLLRFSIEADYFASPALDDPFDEAVLKYGLTRFPEKLLEKVFSYLNSKDRAAFPIACRLINYSSMRPSNAMGILEQEREKLYLEEHTLRSNVHKLGVLRNILDDRNHYLQRVLANRTCNIIEMYVRIFFVLIWLADAVVSLYYLSQYVRDKAFNDGDDTVIVGLSFLIINIAVSLLGMSDARFFCSLYRWIQYTNHLNNELSVGIPGNDFTREIKVAAIDALTGRKAFTILDKKPFDEIRTSINEKFKKEYTRLNEIVVHYELEQPLGMRPGEMEKVEIADYFLIPTLPQVVIQIDRIVETDNRVRGSNFLTRFNLFPKPANEIRIEESDAYEDKSSENLELIKVNGIN